MTLVFKMLSRRLVDYSKSDAPRCGITYDHHSDDSRGVTYNHNIFITQTPCLSLSQLFGNCFGLLDKKKTFNPVRDIKSATTFSGTTMSRMTLGRMIFWDKSSPFS